MGGVEKETLMQRAASIAFALTLAVTAAGLSGVARAEDFSHDVLSFSGEDPASGWRLNIHGRNAAGEKGSGKVETVPGRNGASAVSFSTVDAGAYNFVSSEVADGEWRNRTYAGLLVWYRGNGSKDKSGIVLLTAGPDGKTSKYVANLFLGDEGWRRVVLTGFWRRRGTPPLDFSRLKRVHVKGNGTRAVTIGRLALLEGTRDVQLSPRAAPQITVPEAPDAPELDGVLDDPLWGLAQPVTEFHVGAERTPAVNPTAAYVVYKGTTLYVGVRLRGEAPDAIPAKWRDFDTSVWQDSCTELYLDPGDTNAAGHQFVVNSIGTRQDICGTKGWNGDWRAAARIDPKDGWSVEIACELAEIANGPLRGAAWGFNLKRHVVGPDGKFLEVSGWAQTSPKPASGFGAILFEPTSAAPLQVHETELRELAEGRYALRVRIANQGAEPVEGTVAASVLCPAASAKHDLREPFTVDAGRDAEVGLPLEFPLARDGEHLLTLTTRDASGLVVDFREFSFWLSRRTEVDFADIVLWPPPQVWKLRPEAWIVPETVALSVQGQGDAFPAEHLADMLTRRYGVAVQRRPGAEDGLRLVYDGRGIKPEGFVLDVDASGVALRAGDGPGMYYGVRSLLDLIKQSTLGEAEVRAREVHCKDWPATKLRVHYHRIDHGYQVPFGPETYKSFLYNQIAGGRFNLLIINCRGGLRYKSHPEVARRGALTPEQMTEILGFARRHYVDVAPGGNSPGHAIWFVSKHREMAEDGDLKTLCTRHPDALPLLKEMYGELIDLFQPTKYFHLGGDEVRWKTAAVAPEKRCQRCKGLEKRELALEHWTALAEFCTQKGVRPILWEDMLSEQWNGGGLYNVARILPRLLKNIIMSSWSSNELSNSAAVYRKLGFTPWRVTTSFAPSRMDNLLAWCGEYEALGIAQFTSSPWLTFSHFDYNKHCRYATPAIHCCAACIWKPEVSTVGWERLVASHGLHWSRVMEVTEWGVRRVRFAPISIAQACGESTVDAAAGDGAGWLDLGPDKDLRAAPRGRMTVGAVPFERPSAEKDCIVVRGENASPPVAVDRRVRGFVFLHTAAANADEQKKLGKRILRKNTAPTGMPVAFYRVAYADGSTAEARAQLGRNIHLWDCTPRARVMQGASAFWVGLTAGQVSKDPNNPDACLWTMEWKNPQPGKEVKHVTVVSAGTEATVALLGLTAVE